MIEGCLVSRWTTVGQKVSVTQWCGVDEVKGGSCGKESRRAQEGRICRESLHSMMSCAERDSISPSYDKEMENW